MAEIDATNLQGVGFAIVLAFEVPNLFSGLLPSKFTIATFTGQGEERAAHTKRWIRDGEAQATLMSLALAVGGTLLTRSPLPLLFSLAMIAWLLAQYEHALRAGLAGGLKLDMAAGV